MPSGRVRQFDAEEALDRALEVFWRRGYEGATLDELTAAMGINRPSLYAAFGNKEQLFRQSLERYLEGPAASVRDALARPTAREVFESLLMGGVRASADCTKPRGCLVVGAALSCGAAADPIREELAAARERGVAEIRERFERAVREKDLPKRTDCAALARYVATVMHGLAVQAAGGVDPDEMRRAAELAVASWPA